MSKLSEIVGLPEEPRLEVREYRKTLDDWLDAEENNRYNFYDVE